MTTIVSAQAGCMMMVTMMIMVVFRMRYVRASPFGVAVCACVCARAWVCASPFGVANVGVSSVKAAARRAGPRIRIGTVPMRMRWACAARWSHGALAFDRPANLCA